MNTQVTSEQIEFYRENGFLVIDDFLQVPSCQCGRMLLTRLSRNL